MATAKKKKPAKKPCGCFARCNKAMQESHGVAYDSSFSINFETGKISTVGPFLRVHWHGDKPKRKALPSVLCAYCPFCGKKNP